MTLPTLDRIPNMGTLMPVMGITHPPERRIKTSGLAAALFSTTQQRVLGLLFGQPDRSFYATELIGLTGSGSGAVQRELARLEHSALVMVSRRGTQKHYQANPDSPLFNELCGIARKTIGLAEPVREALAPMASTITAAFVYGSVAKRSDTALSDIDLLILSDQLDYADLFASLHVLEARLGRKVNPSILSRKELAQRQQDGNAFLQRVLAQPKIWIIGDERDFTA